MKLLIPAATLLLLATAAIPALTNYYVNERFTPMFSETNGNMQAHYPEILKDLELLKQNPPFPATEYKHNAEPLLSQHIEWDGAADRPRLNTPEHQALTQLTEKYPQWRTDDTQLNNLIKDPLYKSLDLSWMEQLQELDHFDRTTKKEYMKQLEKIPQLNGIGRIGVFASLPYPDLAEARLLAYLYVLKHPNLQGMKIHRKVAELVATDGTLVGQMVALGILKDEAKLAPRAHLPDPTPNENILNAYKRVSWAWVGLSRMAWFAEFPEDFKPYLKPELGMCAGAWESTTTVSGLQDFFGPALPFEPNFISYIDRARTFSEQQFKTCHLEAYQPFLQPTAEGANPWIEPNSSYFAINNGTHQIPGGLNLSRVPYLRRVIGLTLMGIMAPNYLSLYEQPKG